MKSWPALARIAVLIVLGLAAASVAPQERNGTYWGLNLGVFFPHSIETDGRDNDVVPTGADRFLPNPVPLQSRGTSWENRFDMDTGALGGLTVGYLMDSFRFEFEYLYRTGGGDSSSLGGNVTGRTEEQFAINDENLDNFESHHLFTNVYYDFLNTSRFTPYFGIGVGWATTQVDYTGLFTRDTGPAAGTVTRGEQKFDDDGFGYQLLVGLDYWLAEHLSLGMKFRYADFDGVDSGRHEWDTLRSHDSAISPGGERVTYEIDSDDLRFWGASLNLKYRF